MSYLERASVAAPVSLLREPGFWKACRPLVATVVGGIAFILYLEPITHPQSHDPTAWLTVFIQLLVFWGVAVGVRAFARLEVDDAIARIVERRATSELAKIKGRLKERISLDRLATNLLPHNPSHDKGMLRLFQHILEEAKDRKFHANAVIIQPFREEGLGDLLRIQTVQRLALQLGILGTFVGLIIALRNLTRGGKDLLKAEALNELFSALHISFSTSIAGLEVAMVLAVVLLMVRRRQEAFFQDMESSSAALISLARNSINEDDFLVELDQMRTVLTGVGERIREQAREVEIQTTVIREGLRRLAELKVDFDSFLGRIREEQGVVLREMKSVYDVISPRNVAEELKQSLTTANRQVAESFRENLHLGLTELGAVTDGLKLIREVGDQARLGWEQQSQGFEENRDAFRQATVELAEVSRVIARSQAEPLARIDSAAPRSASLQSEGVEKSLDKVAKHLEILSRELDRNNRTLAQVASAHSYYRSMLGKPGEWWESFVRLCNRLRIRMGGAS